MKNITKPLKSDKHTLISSSERYENAYYEFLKNSLNRMVDGFFIFKTRKGELLAGATTFFTLITLSPLLLLVITMYGKMVGDLDQAYAQVMISIKETMPHLAPWIFKSLQTIIKSQLSKDSLNWFNIGLLFYTGAGLSGTLVFGMSNIADIRQRGGWIVETFKSVLSAAFVTAFILISLTVSFQTDLIISLVKDIPVLSTLAVYASKSFFQAVLLISLLTLYYKHITPKNIRYSDGFFGAVTTMTLFFTAKTFYWIYIHYMKAELVQSFGNFYTMIVAVLYIYFMVCSFFYGASVAYSPSYKRGKHPQAVKPIPTPEAKEEGPPDLPMAG
jgi:membrane protein